MLFELENTTKESLSKLLKFAKDNHLKLSLLDDQTQTHFLPGKAFTPDQLSELIAKSRKSGMIALEDAHSIIAAVNK